MYIFYSLRPVIVSETLYSQVDYVMLYLLLITTLTSSACATVLLVFNQLSMGWLIFEEEWIVKGSWHFLASYLASRLLDYNKDEDCPYSNCSNHQHHWQSNMAMGFGLHLWIYCRSSTQSMSQKNSINIMTNEKDKEILLTSSWFCFR